MKLWTKVLFLAVWAVLVSALLLTFIIFYWNFAPYEGLTDVPQPSSVSEAVVERGGYIMYHINYCVAQSLPLPLTIQRSIELQNLDPTVLPTGSIPIAPPLVYQITERCESRDIFIGIPMYAPVGRYHIHSETEVKVNPFRSVHQLWTSEDFEITASTRFSNIKNKP